MDQWTYDVQCQFLENRIDIFRRPSTSGGDAPTSTVAPSPSSRWKSRRLRLRSKPAYNIELGPPLDSSRRQAGACHWRRPFFMAVLTMEALNRASESEGYEMRS